LLSYGEEAFADIQIPIEETPEVIVAREEEAKKQEAKEKLKKSHENQVFKIKLSIREDLNQF